MSTLATNQDHYYIGVDVGTGSARAALVAGDGTILSESSYPTTTYRDDHNHDVFEQSTTESKQTFLLEKVLNPQSHLLHLSTVWDSIAKACQDCLRESKISPEKVKGIGFDATCSLAVSTQDGQPMSITHDQWGIGHSKRNIILWADHRAREEANLINSTNSPVLKYVGGTMSLEMEIPKVLWLKKHMPDQFFKQSMFFDLPDFLTYKATGHLARSNCSLACE